MRVDLLIGLLCQLLVRLLVNEELDRIQNPIVRAADPIDRKECRGHQWHIQLEKLERIHILMQEMQNIAHILLEVRRNQSAGLCGRAVAVVIIVTKRDGKAHAFLSDQNHIIGGRILVGTLANKTETQCGGHRTRSLLGSHGCQVCLLQRI